jgi:Spy/CpxP family protein refolding chaperone
MFRSMARLAGVCLILTLALAAAAQDPAPANPPPGRGPGGRPPGSRGGMGGESRWLGMALDELGRELNLTEEQREKIKKIVDQTRESVQKRLEAARASGDWQTLRGEFEKIPAEVQDKVKAELTTEQKEKFAKTIEEHRSRWEGRFGGGGGGFGSPEQRVNRAMEALKIANAQEAEAVKSLVARVVKLQADLSEFDRKARDKYGELLKTDGISDATLEERLKAFRAERKTLDEQLQKVRDELGKVLSPRQEIELIRQGLTR